MANYHLPTGNNIVLLDTTTKGLQIQEQAFQKCHTKLILM